MEFSARTGAEKDIFEGLRPLPVISRRFRQLIQPEAIKRRRIAPLHNYNILLVLFIFERKLRMLVTVACPRINNALGSLVAPPSYFTFLSCQQNRSYNDDSTATLATSGSPGHYLNNTSPGRAANLIVPKNIGQPLQPKPANSPDRSEKLISARRLIRKLAILTGTKG
jgi:hypothetical protein